MIVLDRSGMRRVMLAAVALGLLSGAGCRQTQSPAVPTPVDERRAVLEREGDPLVTQPAPVETDVSDGSAAVPAALLALYKEDLVRRALVPVQAITVVSASERHWPDGSMGCAQPGRMYTQALIPGYLVVLRAAGKDYAYHADRRGGFVVCDRARALPPVSEQLQQRQLE